VYVDDEVGIITHGTGGLVCTEAHRTATFSILLASEPTSSVTVRLNSSDVSEGTLGGVFAITFTQVDWSVARTVTVTGVDDEVVDGNITFSVTSIAVAVDTNYHGIVGIYVNLTTNDGNLWLVGFCVLAKYLPQLHAVLFL
jgi:hypothetical protein